MGRYASMKHAGRTLLGRLNRRLDVGHPPTSQPPPTSVWFGSVYRERNAGLVHDILGPRADWHVHLWALDEVSPVLRDETRGTGAGGKFELLQRLLDLAPPPP